MSFTNCTPRTYSLLLSLLTAIVFLTTPLYACASTPRAEAGFSIRVEPGSDKSVTSGGFFLYQSSARGKETGRVRLSNPTNRKISVELNSLDAVTASNGGAAFNTNEVDPIDVGLWLHLDKSLVTLLPGEDMVVDFQVTVPAITKPGQYLAGISASEASTGNTTATHESQTANTTSASITTRTRYVIAVELDIPGDWVPSLKIDGMTVIEQPSGPIIGLKLRNDGATFLHPRGTLLISDSDGSPIRSIDIDMPTFVTGTEVVFPVSWQGEITPGSYTARLNLNYGEDKLTTYEATLVFSETSSNLSSITIEDFAVQQHLDPDTNEIQFADISISISNPGSTVTKGQLALHIERNGVFVEDFVLGTDLTIPEGSVRFDQRYLPIAGWVSGTYSFRIDLQVVDPNSGQITSLTTASAQLSVDA